MKQGCERIPFEFPSFPLLRNGKLGNLRQRLEDKSLRVSRRNTEIYGR